MKKDALGDRMKAYEAQEAGRRLIPMLPVLARIDGRCFSKFTKQMRRPYDERLSKLMVATTEYLCRESNAVMGYTQSDEISLAWWAPSYESEIFFGGRIQKMTSQLAALASTFFVYNYQDFFEERLDDRLRPGDFPADREYFFKPPTFDCRVWNVPTAEEGANTFLWREMDASKNSISMAARSLFSHKELLNRNGGQMQEMMWQKGTNWNDYPSFFKRGTFIQRRTIARKLTFDERERLPEKHAARQNPDLVIERSEFQRLEMPPFGTVSNRAEVVFEGAEPKIAV